MEHKSVYILVCRHCGYHMDHCQCVNEEIKTTDRKLSKEALDFAFGLEIIESKYSRIAMIEIERIFIKHAKNITHAVAALYERYKEADSD